MGSTLSMSFSEGFNMGSTLSLEMTVVSAKICAPWHTLVYERRIIIHTIECAPLP